MKHHRVCVTVVALAASASMALAAAPSASAERSRAEPGSRTFGFTGAPERFTVPDGICVLSATVYGASGGAGQYGVPGGEGARVSASLPVAAGQTLTADVGGRGHDGDADASRARGGHGGGGRGGTYVAGGRVSGIASGGGGGRTVVSSGSTPLVVAGGGGGGGSSFFSSAFGGGHGGRTGEPGVGAPGDGESEPGRPGGQGGAGGVNVPNPTLNGENGFRAVGRVGGRGGDSIADPHGGAGGGGGGGAVGGGGGAASPTAYHGGAGGGGGSSTGPAGATYASGARAGDGEVTFDWEPCATGGITVVKTDAANGRSLPGAALQVWRETNGEPGAQRSGNDPDTRSGSACATDRRGRCDFADLPLGTYYLQETAVPDGYRLPADPVTGPLVLETAGQLLDTRTASARDACGTGGGQGCG